MRKLKILFTVLVAYLVILPASATDGYFSLGYGSRHKGVAGAGISLHHFSLIGGNPAGNVGLETGYMISAGLFNPLRDFSISGNPSGSLNSFGLNPGSVESDSKLFIVPAAGANWKLAEHHAIGVSIYGNGGMNTDYPTAAFHDQSSATTGVNLSQLFTEITYSSRFAEKHSVGVSGVLALQFFEAVGLNSFGQFGLSQDPTKLSNNDSDNSTGFGFKVGYIGEWVENLQLGATYQSKMWMGEFKDYAGLFAEDGDFDIPASWTIGLSYRLDDTWTFMTDIKQILYSGVNAVANPMNPASLFPGFQTPDGGFQQNPGFVPLGDENGAGFGWEDMTVFKLGLEHSGSENWIWRGGYSYGAQPIPESEVLFNILAPGVVEHHIALGFSRRVGNSDSMIHFSFNYALSNTVSGQNPLDPVQRIDLTMKQFDFDFGFSF